MHLRDCDSLDWFSRNTKKRSRIIPTIVKSRRTPIINFIWLILLWIQYGNTASAQLNAGHGILHHPERLIRASGEFLLAEPDPLPKIRSMTSRAVITIEGRDHSRFLSLFRASESGHVEFGFPLVKDRAMGSLEILNVARVPSGVRKVTIRHACSDSFLTLDTYGQMRACQLTDSDITPLRSHTHCLDGDIMHTCRRSPHVFLDPTELFLSHEFTPTASSRRKASSNLYKIRFEAKRTPDAKMKHVFYAHVVPATWEVRLRTQLSVMRKATVNAARGLWFTSMHALFRRSILAYRDRRRKRTFPPRLDGCDVDPALVRDEVIANATLEDFEHYIQLMWRRQHQVDMIATSIAWPDMTNGQREIIINVVVRAVKRMLRNSLLDITQLHCLEKTTWGRMSRSTRLARLEANLTRAWLERKTKASRIVTIGLERTLNSKLTNFLIREAG